MRVRYRTGSGDTGTGFLGHYFLLTTPPPDAAKRVPLLTPARPERPSTRPLAPLRLAYNDYLRGAARESSC